MSPPPHSRHALEDYCRRFHSLHTDQHQGRPRPHKPVMLLAVFSLADNGQLLENRIPYGPELLELFRRYFAIVRGPTDQCTPWNPFFYMRSEEFWHLHPQPGREATLGAMRNPGGAGMLMANVAYASLDEDLFRVVAQTASREALRQAIIDRYFSAQRPEILAMCSEERDVGRVRETWRDHEYKVDRGDVPGSTDRIRGTAFARTVKLAYDYRCAACGLRFLYEDITLIDAAHLVPFTETHDDSPQNGIALCKNHHWLMDSILIAPGPGRGADYTSPCWHVRDGLDDRIEGQREVLQLRDRGVILPTDARLRPKSEALDRRMQLLAEAC